MALVTLTQFAAKMASLGPDMERAVDRGLRSAAHRLEGYIVEEIEKAGAVATSELKASVGTDKVDGGYNTGPDAPHAAFVEYGTRPHTPPLQPIIDWVRIKGLAQDDTEVERIAWAIVWHITHYGTKPRHFMAKALDRFAADRVIDQEVNAELRAMSRRRS